MAGGSRSSRICTAGASEEEHDRNDAKITFYDSYNLSKTKKRGMNLQTQNALQAI